MNSITNCTITGSIIMECTITGCIMGCNIGYIMNSIIGYVLLLGVLLDINCIIGYIE